MSPITLDDSLGQLGRQIRASIATLETMANENLILNPAESTPRGEILAPIATSLHGVYNTDKIRTHEEMKNTNHQFAGPSVPIITETPYDLKMRE